MRYFLPALLGLLLFGCAKSSNGKIEYHSYALVQILRSARSSDVVDDAIISGEDARTVVLVASSHDLKRRYWRRVVDEGLERSVADPYLGEREYSDEVGFEVFSQNTVIGLVRLSLIVEMGFIHTDPEITRSVADLMAEEFLKYEGEIAEEDSRALRSRFISHAFLPKEPGINDPTNQ
ncbi:hypothetical protein [Actomonas aquatica]|uniref:Uncharacterized protein n=1 Tax=Actomonas aquatica TaxID=2866162 RepID=A0ABZ1CBF7_9BACT|nr:hypothetical protein [Opitutus sp. WL0086]WRQ88833.1 hypothetical protein K1X11_005410 [Opitutus sp. WL0086]